MPYVWWRCTAVDYMSKTNTAQIIFAKQSLVAIQLHPFFPFLNSRYEKKDFLFSSCFISFLNSQGCGLYMKEDPESVLVDSLTKGFSLHVLLLILFLFYQCL
jgi:hypothetical protein